MSFFATDSQKTSQLFSLATIGSALCGTGLMLAGLSIHPLMKIIDKEDTLDEKLISVWSVTVNNSTKTWQKYIGSPSSMPIEVAAATMITAAVLSCSSFFKLRPATKLVSAHGLLLSAFFATSALTSMAAGFAVHHNVEMFYPFWMAVAGTVILFSGGLVGHVGKQMEKSSSRFSLSNIIFYVLALSSAGLFFTAAGLDTFGDSSNYCTVPDLKLCVPYEPVTRMGLFKVCEGDLIEGAVENEKCSTWDNVNPEKTENFQWAVSFIFAMYLLAGCAMIASFIVKLLWDSLRGIATSFTVFALGAAITAQCLMSTLVTSYYHRYDEVYNELRYDAQFYGSAYYISLAGLITTAITLASILGEESSNSDYMSNKKSAIYDASNFDSSRTTQVKDEKVETLN